MALACGSVQLAVARRWSVSAPRAHRVLGRLYVGAAWTASSASFVVAVLFDVPAAARAAFATGSVLWFVATTVAFVHIRNRHVEQHRAWMVRSFSLSFFFVTGSLWMPAMAATGLPHAVSYPLSIVLGWSLNLAAAEWWVRRSRG